MVKIAAILALPCVAAAGSLLQSADVAQPGKYVIKLKSSADKSSLAKVASAFNADKTYSIGRSFKGFSATLTPEQLEEMLANDAVDIISPNVRVYTTGIIDAKIFNAPNVTAKVSQNGCPDSQAGVDTVDLSWGQARVTSPGLNEYLHDASWGAGVDVYVTDTGTLCAHEEFEGRSCTCGPDFSAFIGGPDMTGGCADGNGHGTFCSSIAAGNVYGIAKSANIIGVKVMGDAGSGSLNSIVDGFNYVAEQAAATGNPSVCSVSLGTQGTNALVDAAANALAEVAPTAIAAGNSGEMIDRLANTCTGSSPGAAEVPITVGSSDIADSRSSFSNYGSCNDVFAPGSAITGAYSSRSFPTDQYITGSGTSMATPHVAGLIAAILSVEPTLSPEEVKAKIIGDASADTLNLACDAASGTANCEASPNLLLHTEYCA